MPTYDYQCLSCDEITEIFHSIKDSPKRKCPQCRKLTLKRLISGGAGVLFKGDGFYVNDSKKVSSKKSDTVKKDTDSDEKSTASSESTTNTTTKEKKESSNDVDKKSKKVKITHKKNSKK